MLYLWKTSSVKEGFDNMGPPKKSDYFVSILMQWQSQKFRPGGGGEIKSKKMNLKKFININNKINKQLYANVITVQNLT